MDWIKNGPDVEKPKGLCLVRLRCNESLYWLATWTLVVDKHWWWGASTGAADSDVTHFAVVTEPEDE